jgi:HTH-type transcriptional regulator / antitoxin HigA
MKLPIRSWMMMHELDIKKTARAWLPLAGTIFVPHTDEEYNQIVALLDQLIDDVREDESHPLASSMEILGVLIEHYENAHVPELIED